MLYASTLFENKDLLLALGGAGCRVWASMASIEAVVTQLPTSVEGDSLGLAPYFLGCWKGAEEIDEEFKSRAWGFKLLHNDDKASLTTIKLHIRKQARSSVFV